MNDNMKFTSRHLANNRRGHYCQKLWQLIYNVTGLTFSISDFKHIPDAKVSLPL